MGSVCGVVIEGDWAYRLYGEDIGYSGHYGHYGGKSGQKRSKTG